LRLLLTVTPGNRIFVYKKKKEGVKLEKAGNKFLNKFQIRSSFDDRFGTSRIYTGFMTIETYTKLISHTVTRDSFLFAEPNIQD